MRKAASDRASIAKSARGTDLEGEAFGVKLRGSRFSGEQCGSGVEIAADREGEREREREREEGCRHAA